MTLASQIILAVHVLAMVGAFGGLLVFQTALPPDARRDIRLARGLARVVNILIGLGLLAGAVRYGLLRGHTLGGHFNGVIALKFILLLAIGALVGISAKSERGDRLRGIAAFLLALAALLGSTIWL